MGQQPSGLDHGMGLGDLHLRGEVVRHAPARHPGDALVGAVLLQKHLAANTAARHHATELLLP